MTFRVGWGVFQGAGEIRILAESMPAADGPAQLRVTTTTATRGFARMLFAFEAQADALFDGQTGRLLTNTESTKTPNRETKHTVTFDYAKSVASYVDPLNAAKNTTFTLPPGDPFDLIMSLVQTRSWALKPGEQRDALVLFEDEFYELTLHALRYEEVRTPLGKFNTLVLEPRMEKTPPKGMFKRGSTVCVWISQDEQRLPVKFQVEFRFGAGVATLMDYKPPSSDKADATRSAAPDAKNSRP